MSLKYLHYLIYNIHISCKNEEGYLMKTILIAIIMGFFISSLTACSTESSGCCVSTQSCCSSGVDYTSTAVTDTYPSYAGYYYSYPAYSQETIVEY